MIKLCKVVQEIIEIMQRQNKMNGISAKNESKVSQYFCKIAHAFHLDWEETSARFLKYKQKQ